MVGATGVDWLGDSKTVDDAMAAALQQYLLGIASDFCAFIENDFTATEADAEGRVAVGGNLSFKGDWNYQIGSGDYAKMTSLINTDNYSGASSRVGFAHVLCGGKLDRINTLSTGHGNGKGDEGMHTANKGSEYSYAVYFNPEDDLFKRFIVGNVEESEHLSKDNENVAYSSELLHNHDYPGDCGESCPHQYLESVNELAQIYQYSQIKEIIYSAFSKIRSRSRNLSQMAGVRVSGDGNTLTLTVPENMEHAKTIYFDIGDSWNDYRSIYFENVPDDVNLIVNCGDSNVNIGGNVATYINGEKISNSGTQGDYSSNNNKESERILYNFYNASEVTISGNFNGTILSPNADVKSPDETCPGHLSGALIAKSFYGGLEFGYRPYRGGSEILGLTSGYYVPVDKLITGTDNSVSGATLAAITAKNSETNEIVFTWTTDGKTSYVPFPSKIDYSGATDYTQYVVGSDNQGPDNIEEEIEDKNVLTEKAEDKETENTVEETDNAQEKDPQYISFEQHFEISEDSPPVDF